MPDPVARPSPPIAVHARPLGIAVRTATRAAVDCASAWAQPDAFAAVMGCGAPRI